MRKSNFALRLQASLMEEAKRVAATEGVAFKPTYQCCGGGEVCRCFGQRIISGSVERRVMLLGRSGLVGAMSLLLEMIFFLCC